MKIKEFIEKVNENERMEAEEVDGVIAIYNDSDLAVVEIPCDATNLLEIKFVENYYLYSFGKPSREYLSALIEEFLHTSIKERFPEKKYVLSAMRCAEGPVPVKQYVDAMNISANNVEFHFGFANEKADAMEFTQKKLDSLSDFFPKAAIDAMKEPMEDIK
ncbi:hypothetical protein HHK02_06965 [Limosilactobacillus reuteri]|uniref:Uncharacterized protein n=1 Tax=Limosilactobacillus reuteri TaxID=1598 RepID=A0A7L6BFR4_LIMRT|nr:hypothetical protein [Limosilactobacillus reuteri]QLQ60963.1 hypothetical protein HHK02_06965 [Limosilactobacillus reuteri]